ncbi:MAG: hypothetical protein JRD89_02370 [Deltaproteobacteria bacterium]|nr:hypothetical protein [Deltaproteobacteria bacterium]
MPRVRLSVQELQSVLDVIDAAVVIGDDRPCLWTAAADLRAALPAETTSLRHDCMAAGCAARRLRYQQEGLDYHPLRESDLSP